MTTRPPPVKKTPTDQLILAELRTISARLAIIADKMGLGDITGLSGGTPPPTPPQ